MIVQISHLVDGAKSARGIAVIIDVFRAFTTACFVMNNSAKTILPVTSVELAYNLKIKHPEYILMGERGEVMLPGFDFGNSPANIQNVDFSNKTVIHTTSAGTKGISNAVNADEVLTGSLVNAHAIVRYIQSRKPKTVTLVCMGKEAKHPIEEDTWCAEYIKSLLEKKPYDIGAKINQLREGEGKRFFNPETQEQSPEKDFYLSTSVGIFDFVLKAHPIDKNVPLYSLIKIPV